VTRAPGNGATKELADRRTTTLKVFDEAGYRSTLGSLSPATLIPDGLEVARRRGPSGDVRWKLQARKQLMRLAGKVAVVTGGTSGIGRRVVERFRAEGAEVVFTGRRAVLGDEIAAASGATFIEADAGSEADAERTIQHTLDRHGRIDILMNNAGGLAPAGRLEALPFDGFDAAIRVHVRGALAHIKHVAAPMRAQGAGSIINVGSVAGHRAGYRCSMIYAIAKAAVIHMTRCAAM
jgi:NAD(P)-dependent dehydrogenase (short-subunit alcohol dehydrogenase family)